MRELISSDPPADAAGCVLDKIPPADVVRVRLSALLREVAIARKLLQLAERADRERADRREVTRAH